ncbi:MAG: hypothetical protein R8L53_05580 [Mariprofundales bacterium]
MFEEQMRVKSIFILVLILSISALLLSGFAVYSIYKPVEKTFYTIDIQSVLEAARSRSMTDQDFAQGFGKRFNNSMQKHSLNSVVFANYAIVSNGNDITEKVMQDLGLLLKPIDSDGSKQ